MMDKPKKKVDPDAPIRPTVAIITWLLLNVIWTAIIPMATPHPILSPDSGHRTVYLMTVPSVGSDDLPFSIECDFQASEAGDSLMVAWELWDVDDRIAYKGGDSRKAPIAAWGGATGEDCSSEISSIPSGEYEWSLSYIDYNGTELTYQEGAERVDAEFTMAYQIYHNQRVFGYIVANIMGFIILITDQAVRRWRKAKRIKRKRMPLHKQRHKEEWDALHEIMDGKGEAGVESFQIEFGASAEEERERIRKRFAEQDDDEDEVGGDIEVEELDSDEELGEGDASGLEGKARVDKDIETVGDLWRRIEEDEV